MLNTSRTESTMSAYCWVKDISLRMRCFRTCMSSHKKGTSHDTSFAVAGSDRALSRFVCLVKVPLHIQCQGHSLPVGCLSCSSLALHLVYLRCEPLACSLKTFPRSTEDKRRRKKSSNQTAKGFIHAHFSLRAKKGGLDCCSLSPRRIWKKKSKKKKKVQRNIPAEKKHCNRGTK